ncbi:Succinate dehydrogenase subunit Emi5 [Phytophthora palmivora]|uniref:Succinate dehydrogenase subunit Emi5 n=1 Tax=Phytophthora palmivora TaxID=4796 RepID=A0A2P4XKW9_9STRA|nr:Succinate dehydrogenase subunit Emi5 [Phytophthora palmivora]
MMRIKVTQVLAMTRRSSKMQPLRLLSTNPEVDNNAFVKSISSEQAKKALERSASIRADHIATKGDFPSASHGEHQVDSDEANRKRIIYRSKQRGWLEVDLLLGRWASQNVMQLSKDELKQYEDILNEETIDIFNYISGKSDVPEQLDTPMMKRLQEYCLSSPLGKASIEGFAENKKFMSN